MNMINGLPYGGLQNSSFNSRSAVGGVLGAAMGAAMGNAQSAMQNGSVNQAMNQATAQIASAVAQEMVAAVTQAAMPYTGQGNAFGQVRPGIGSGGGYAQIAAQQQQQQQQQQINAMRASILTPQIPNYRLPGIRGL